MMPDRDSYRGRALECTAAAEHIRDLQERAAMLAIAQAFLKMADRIGARYERATAHRVNSDQHPDKDS